MGTEFLPALMLLVATAAGVLSIYGMAALVRSSSVEIERDEEISQAGGVGAERISFGWTGRRRESESRLHEVISV